MRITEFNALIVELAKVLWEPEKAKDLVLSIGFPPEDLPRFQTPRGFWRSVVTEAENGKVHGGAQAIAEVAVNQYPGNDTLVSCLPAVSPSEDATDLLSTFRADQAGPRERGAIVHTSFCIDQGDQVEVDTNGEGETMKIWAHWGPVALVFDLTNPHEEDLSVRQIFVETIGCRAISEAVDYRTASVVGRACCLGIGAVRQYECFVESSIGEVMPAQPIGLEKDSYIKLSSGEQEMFSILVNASRVGIYQLAVRVKFSVQGQVRTARILQTKGELEWSLLGPQDGHRGDN
ncbi:MAG: effector-associated domain EAD1-containing protein [Myxococcota bacterium]